jgi:cyclase
MLGGGGTGAELFVSTSRTDTNPCHCPVSLTAPGFALGGFRGLRNMAKLHPRSDPGAQNVLVDHAPANVPAKTGGFSMKKTLLAALAASTMLIAAPALAQQQPDWDKIQIKTTDLGNKTYRLEGQGGNITLAVGSDGLIMVDTQFAPLSDKIKAAVKAISPLPIKYIILTHFHGDHTGGVANFQKDGAIALAQDNIRLRLLGGTTNGTTGNKMAPLSGDAIPKETYIGGTKTIEVGGRKAILTHYYNAHTDGDTGVFFPDANVIATGDIMNNNHGYQQVDYANGGDIRGMIRATDDWLKMANDQTKVQTGHGPLGNKKSIADFNEMVKAAREKVEKLVREGKTEAEVVAADPLKELTATWGTANPQAGVNMTKQVYNSFKRS